MPKPSLRGLSFDFEPEEHVLCFEPDPTKARVLYEAKILEAVPARDHKGHRRPEYLIHFQGWNSSWDRTVPEGFVLKNSDRNRLLMRRLASTTRHASNRMRRKKIDEILNKHFKRGLPKFNWSDSDSDSDSSSSSGSSSSEDGTEDGDRMDSNVSSSQDEKDMGSDDSGDVDIDQDNFDEDKETDGARNNQLNGHQQSTDSELSESDDEIQFSQLNGNGNMDEDADAVALELDLPKNLRSKLEDDCYYIRCKDKLLSLPADPNVLSILEGYVKNFAANVLCATEEKSKHYSIRDKDKGLPAEKNIELCKQVADGLRLSFDFGLPLILLYDEEKPQFESLQDSEMRPAVQSPMRSSHPTPTQPMVSPPRSSRSPRFSPRHTKEEEDEEEEEEEEEEEQESSDEDQQPSRRMTRHSFQAEVKKSKQETPKQKVEPVSSTSASRGRHHRDSESRKHKDSGSGGDARDDDDKGEDSNRRDSLRSRSRHGSGAGPSALLNPAPVDKETRRPSNTSEKTEPLNLPDGVSVHSSSAHTSNSQDTDGAISFRYREAALANIFSWSLVPEEVVNQKPATPSAIYGAQHLLRLFVKLPEIIGRMQLAPVKLDAVKTHLELFLQYLSTRSEELFLDSHYDNAD